MGRSPCCLKVGLNRGAWTSAEDKILSDYIHLHGEGHWRNLPKRAGLQRCGKSCRLRWLNYLRPDIKRGNISGDEEDLIIRLHRLLGNRWALIAGRLPGRTDNEIKNYWNTTLRKKAHDNHTPSSPSSPTKQCNSKKTKKHEKNRDKLESTHHSVKKRKVVQVTPQKLGQSINQQLLTDTTSTVEPLVVTQTSMPKENSSIQSLDLVPDSNDVGLTEFLDFDFSGLLDTGDHRDRTAAVTSSYEKPGMDVLDEFWSTAEELNQQLPCNSNLYFASVSDFLGDWLA